MTKRIFTLPGCNIVDLQDYLKNSGEKPFRAKQILSWLYGKCEFDPARMLNLPAALREKLQEECQLPGSRVIECAPGSGGTEKLLIEHPERSIRIPMISSARCLNLSNSAAIVIYEALRQNNFASLTKESDYLYGIID